MKKYFDLNYNGEPYDAVGRRKGQDLFYILGGGKVGGTQGAAGTGVKGIKPKAPSTTATSGGSKLSGAGTKAPVASAVKAGHGVVKKDDKHVGDSK